MKRRALLATVGAASTALAGCSSLLNAGGDDEATPTDTQNGTGEADQRHDLYLANLRDETLRIHVALRRTDTDEQLLSGRYELDNGQAAKFENAAGWGGEYEVTATLPTDATATYDWPTESCPDDGYSRNASLRVGGDDGDGDGFSFVVDACDALVAGTAASAGPAETFKIEGDGTTSS